MPVSRGRARVPQMRKLPIKAGCENVNGRAVRVPLDCCVQSNVCCRQRYTRPPRSMRPRIRTASAPLSANARARPAAEAADHHRVADERTDAWHGRIRRASAVALLGAHARAGVAKSELLGREAAERGRRKFAWIAAARSRCATCATSGTAPARPRVACPHGLTGRGAPTARAHRVVCLRALAGDVASLSIDAPRMTSFSAGFASARIGRAFGRRVRAPCASRCRGVGFRISAARARTLRLLRFATARSENADQDRD